MVVRCWGSGEQEGLLLHLGLSFVIVKGFEKRSGSCLRINFCAMKILSCYKQSLRDSTSVGLERGSPVRTLAQAAHHHLEVRSKGFSALYAIHRYPHTHVRHMGKTNTHESDVILQQEIKSPSLC